jgi:hypothetical protein
MVHLCEILWVEILATKEHIPQKIEISSYFVFIVSFQINSHTFFGGCPHNVWLLLV